MAQTVFPVSDVQAGDWSDLNGGGTTNLYLLIDDPVASPDDDTTAIGALTSSPYIGSLGGLSVPAAGTVSLVVRYKEFVAAGSITCAAALLEGSTVIKGDTALTSGSSAYNTNTINLTTGERNSIGNWTNLRVRLTITANTNPGNNYGLVTQAYLTAPDAAPNNKIAMLL